MLSFVCVLFLRIRFPHEMGNKEIERDNFEIEFKNVFPSLSAPVHSDIFCVVVLHHYAD
jgi:hypothetical protein